MTCGTCNGVTGDGMHLCAKCTEKLEQDLAEVNSLWEDLQITIAKLDKGADSVGSSGGHAGSSEPLNLHAHDKRLTMAEILTGWAETLGHPTRDALQASDILFSRIREVRRKDWAPVLKEELRVAMGQCRAATDRAAERVRLGKCLTEHEGVRCPGTVMSIQGHSTGRCKTCGTTVDIRQYQEAMIMAAGHKPTPLPTLVRALRQFGHLPGVPLKRVEHWVARGRLGPVIPFRHLYTAHDVMEAYLVTEAYNAERDAQKEANRAKREAKAQAEAAQHAGNQLVQIG